jgi:co-chaperonin GroES (HSP10)
MPSTVMEHIVDPKEAILQRVGDLSSITIFGHDVLLAVYERPNKTASGIILTDKYREEDRWQGKCHLVLKIGPTAFRDDDGKLFRDVAVGDWVVIRPSDGQLVTLNTLRRSTVSKDDTVLCRIANDLSIKMRVAQPDQIW